MKYIISKKILSILMISIFFSSISIPQIISIGNINYKAEYELMIISPDDFSNNLIPLVTHKVNMGISTIVVTLDDIYESQISFN